MTVRLGSSTSSLKAQRALSYASAGLSTTFERLSSGQRINRASDDAAGLAIADSLNARSRIFNQGVRNLGDGLSLLSIADSAIETLSGIMIRLEELAAQAANGVYSSGQRVALDAEAQALRKEYFRISKSTTFNGQHLFSGEVSSINLQAGVGPDAILAAGIGGALGTGAFLESNAMAGEGGQSFALAAGDINGDGHVDLVSAGESGGNGFATVRLGTGTGGFGNSSVYATEATRSRAVQLYDIDNDGVLDLVTGGEDGGQNGYMTVRLGSGTGSFGAATSFATTAGRTHEIRLGDVNGDGHVDVVAAGADDLLNGTVAVLLGDGRGSFNAASIVQSDGRSSLGIELGDFNGDGILDIVTSGYTDSPFDGSSTVLIGIGDGSFQSGTQYVTEITRNRSHDVAVGDVNGDGHLDFVTHGYDDAASATGGATVYLGDGTGSFNQLTTFSTTAGRGRAVTLADVNGDGTLDAIMAGRDIDAVGTGQATVHIGVGDGTFSGPVSYLTDGSISTSMLLADFNEDGVFDLVTAGQTGGAGSVNVRLGESIDGVAPLLPFSLSTLADARQALSAFKQKREQLAAQRGQIGAFQSRIDVARNVLEVSSENFKAAESRIRDANIAEESSKLVRLNILQQAASSVLAQANQQPSLALQLLGR